MIRSCYFINIPNDTSDICMRLPALVQCTKNIACSERDSLILACANSGTSIYAGFTIFGVLGFMAKRQNVPVGDVAESGRHLSSI